MPLVGNVYPAAFLWKTQFFTYAGLLAFYLGVLIAPAAWPRYARLFGRSLGCGIVWRLAVAILVSTLAVTAWWYLLDGVAHAAGFARPVESLLGSEIRPTDVPWFHRWFWP